MRKAFLPRASLLAVLLSVAGMAQAQVQVEFDLQALTVTEGSEETVPLIISGALPPGAIALVMLRATDEMTARPVEQGVIRFSAAEVSHNVAIEGVAAGNTTVSAFVVTFIGFPSAASTSTLVPAQLAVTVLPPPVHLTLAFEPMSLTVTAGATATATLSLSGVPADVRATVTLISADTATAQVGSMSRSVVFAAATTSHEVTIEGVAEGSATVTAVADTSSLPAGSTVASAELAVTVELALAFEPMSLTVTVGATATATLSLPGVPADAMATVTLISEDTTTARVGSMSRSVVFTAATTSHDVTIEGVTAGNVAVAAAVSTFAGLGGSVGGAQLQVTVVPPPVHLALAFGPMSLTIAAGAMGTALLSLPDVPEGSQVVVELMIEGEAVRLQQRLDFVSFTGRNKLLIAIEGLAVGNATLTAVARELDDLPPESTVASANLAVTVVPLSLLPIETELAFTPASLEVTAGSEETAVLTLFRQGTTATVTVAVTSNDEAIARVGSRSRSVMFIDTMTGHGVTIEGVAAGNAIVTAEATDLHDFPPGSTVMSARLAVTVVLPPPPPVELQLAFEPMSPPVLVVTAGSERTVTLSLPGVPPGAMVTVTVESSDAATLLVESSRSVVFTDTVTSHDVTIVSVTRGNASVTAEADTSDLPPNLSSVMGALLQMRVVPAPVELALAFDPMSLEVPEGGEGTTTLSLPAGVPVGSEVYVALTLSPMGEATARLMLPEDEGAYIEDGVPTVDFTAAMESYDLTIVGVAAGSVSVTAVADISDLPEDSSVASAELAVTVLPTVHLQLAFEPMSLTVAVGDEETAVLSLPDVPTGAEVAVELRVDETTAQVVTARRVTFDAETTSHEVTVLGVVAGNVTVRTIALDRVGLSDDSTIAPTELAVTVVLPTVHLQLAFDPTSLTVTVGSEETAVLSLPDVPAGAEVAVKLGVDGTTAQVVTEPELRFTAATPSYDVTVLGVAAGNVTVNMETVLFDGVSADSSLELAKLAVTVVLPTVHLQLAFDPPALTVAPGRERTATLSLSGVPMGAAVTVELSAADATTAQLVTEPELRFTAATPSYDVTVAGVAEGSATVTAELVSFLGLSKASTVLSAQLQITVAPGLRLRARVLLEGPLQ